MKMTLQRLIKEDEQLNELYQNDATFCATVNTILGMSINIHQALIMLVKAGFNGKIDAEQRMIDYVKTQGIPQTFLVKMEGTRNVVTQEALNKIHSIEEVGKDDNNNNDKSKR